MVRLVPMTETNFESYMEVTIKDYAQEHVKAGNFNPEDAIDLAREQLDRILPERLSTDGHFFNSVEDDNSQNKVGVLWYAVDDRGGMKKAFVYDVIIFEEYRRRGYGSETFQVLEDIVRNQGLDEIALHVFGHNRVARKMYEKLGFVETDVMLSKKLSA